MISLPEIGIEVVPENSGTHGIGAIKHKGGTKKRLSEKYEGKYSEDRYNNKIMESRIDDPLLGAWNNLLFFFDLGFTFTPIFTLNPNQMLLAFPYF
ncbi:MAG: hypothetical protein KAW16_09520 [candidate division Zixibacteria bacterium]|nr:hypothetical protein [candidate division Zixibacteria bacterium]